MNRKTLPMLAIVFTLILLTWATLRANAAWHFFAARSYMTAMYESGTTTQVGIDNAAGRVGLALRRLPDHPDYLTFAGHLLELQADQPGVVGKERREALENAAEYYRKSLAVRPLWPHSWADLLSVKDKLGEVDDEFILALERSVETGPWTPRVQLQVVNSGLRHWDSLAAREQSVVREKAIDALNKRPREVFEIIKRYERPELVCGEAVMPTQIQRWCNLTYPSGNEN